MNINDIGSHIKIRRDGNLGYLILNRPNKKNALSEAMWRAVPEAVAALDADQDVRVIIVMSSTDNVFSAGADIAELEEISKSTARQESNRLAIRDAQRTLARVAKPTIAQISGPCMGGGCGLAIHCDMRFAAETAKFAITPAKLGIVYPLNDTKQLIDLVGPAKAKAMLFSGRLLNAEEALRIGLIDEVYAANALAAAVQGFAAQIAAVSQYSVRAMKLFAQRVVDGQIDDDVETASIFKAAQEGVDGQEGIRAFMEKRQPNFRWNGEES
jgi:enoyl-CoA hydratase/carnithine racemase